MTLPRERQRERGREWKWGREKESCSGSWQLCLSRLHPHSHSPLASSPTLLFPLLSLSLFPATLCQSVTMSWTKRNRSSLNVCQREYARSIWRPTWRSFTHTIQLRPTSLHSLSSAAVAAAVAVAQFQSRLQCPLAFLPLLLPGSISWAFCTQPQPTPQLQPPQPHTHPHASRTAPTSSGEAAVVATAVAVAVACPMTVRCRCCCRCLSAASSASAAVDECVCVCKLNKCTHFCVFVCVYKHM